MSSPGIPPRSGGTGVGDSAAIADDDSAGGSPSSSEGTGVGDRAAGTPSSTSAARESGRGAPDNNRNACLSWKHRTKRTSAKSVSRKYQRMW